MKVLGAMVIDMGVVSNVLGRGRWAWAQAEFTRDVIHFNKYYGHCKIMLCYLSPNLEVGRGGKKM